MKNNYSIKSFMAVWGTSLFLFACSSPTDSGNELSEDGSSISISKITNVSVVKPQHRSFISEILVSGTAHANQKVMVYAKVSGYVVAIKKDIGDQVRKGEVIAVLENPEISGLLVEKQAQLHAKKQHYDRLNGIYQKTPALTNAQEVEEAEAAYVMSQSAYDMIQDQVSFLQVRAPFSGTITQRFVDHGALVQSGLGQSNAQAIVVIQELNPIRLRFPLPESDIAELTIGTSVQVEFPELPGKSFAAEVSRTAGVLDPASKTMQVEVDLNNDLGRIKPGMYAKVRIQNKSRQQVLSLPVTAQAMYQDQFVLWVVQSGVAQRLALKKGLDNKDYFEVLNADIDSNSLVIVRGKGQVQVGQKVEAVIKK